MLVALDSYSSLTTSPCYLRPFAVFNKMDDSAGLWISSGSYSMPCCDRICTAKQGQHPMHKQNGSVPFLMLADNLSALDACKIVPAVTGKSFVQDNEVKSISLFVLLPLSLPFALHGCICMVLRQELLAIHGKMSCRTS